MTTDQMKAYQAKDREFEPMADKKTKKMMTIEENRTDDMTNDWHAMTTDQVLDSLDTNASGLHEADVEARRTKYGSNELTTAVSRPKWKLALDQFASPLIIVLIVCGIITLALGHHVDAAAIFIVLIINAIIGYAQESKAARAVASLASMEPRETTVVRAGIEETIPASELVPGDVIVLGQGDKVPADARIISASGFRVDESMLTGESSPASKNIGVVDADSSIGDRSDMVYSGTIVINGEGRVVVTGTGSGTELGRINDLVQTDNGGTPLQLALKRTEVFISIAVGLVAVVVFAGGTIINGDVDGSFLSAVSLMVAAMPEALPIVLTVAMALGVSRMAKEKAIVRTLPAVETLGAVTVVGSDKTGTLTQNRMTVEKVALPTKKAVDIESLRNTDDESYLRLLRCGALTNDAGREANGDGSWSYSGDAVDMAMMRAADDVGAIDDGDLASERRGHLVYEPERLYSMDIRPDREGRLVQYVKGAPDKLMDMSIDMIGEDGHVAPLDRDVLHERYEEMAGEGLRVIGLASRLVGLVDDSEPHGLTFLGMEGMMDPPRPGVADTVSNLRNAGVRTIMITGDHPLTAKAVGRMIGLDDDRVLTGSDMRRMDDDELASRLESTSVVARVSPEDKLRVVDALKDSGEIVTVTGDGVNDAPALKAADVGVAMGASGTDAARDAGDVVLTDDSFSTIANAVRQGRVTFKAIRGSMMFLLSTAVAAMVAVAVNVLSGAELLFLPIQMLWINFITNGVQDIALGFEPGDGTELDHGPEPAGTLLSSSAWSKIATCGLWMAAVILIMFNKLMESGVDIIEARTMTITLLVLFNFMMAMSSRSESRFLFTLNPFSNRFLLIASFVALGVHALAMYVAPVAAVLGFTALTGMQWLVCLGLSLTVLIVSEGWKAVSKFLSHDVGGIRLRAVERLAAHLH